MRRLLFAVSVTFLLSVSAGGVPVTESAGACETYKQMTGVGDDALDCSPGPNFDVCGAYPDDEKVLMKGPEVNDAVMDDNLAHREYCVRDSSKYDHCVLGNGTSGTELKPPGYVANVAPYFNDKDYQTGGNSPDWSVCLDKNSGIGGEWYSLDDPSINNYLRNNEASLGLSTSQRSGGVHDIDYYYTENPNPPDPKYNPRGGEKGVSLLADCGPLMDGCGNDGISDRGGLNNNEGTYFAFFEDNARIEDYHPQGFNTQSYINPYFNGYVNKIKSLDGPSRYDSQLASNHPDHQKLNPSMFNDTVAGPNNAVQYAYTRYMNWSVDVTGVPYPPFNASSTGPYAGSSGTHLDREYEGDKRVSQDNESIDKTSKAFGNSLAVVAGKEVPGTDIDKGEGFWTDPDDIRHQWKKERIEGSQAFDKNVELHPVLDPIAVQDGGKVYLDRSSNDFTVTESGKEYYAGDVNMDGNISEEDASLIQDTLAGIGSLNSSQEDLADVNKDGSVDNVDVSIIRQISQHLNAKFDDIYDVEIKDQAVEVSGKKISEGNSKKISGNLLFNCEIGDGQAVIVQGKSGDTYSDACSEANLLNWRDYITFDLDLTGPDRGIGFDLEGGKVSSTDPGYVDEVRSTTTTSGNDTAFADIYWQQNSPIIDALEPPVCGDDQNEYLYEEQGESNNPGQYEGRYACTNKSEVTCVSFEGGKPYLYDEGQYLNAGEPGEDVGKLKQDKEVCLKTEWNDDIQGSWYDQDLNKSMCRENNRWGEYGARWINKSYINDHPLAMTGGIDDGWNKRMEEKSNHHLVADPEAEHWQASDDPIDEGFVPVSAGTAQLHKGYNSSYPDKSVVPDIEPQTGDAYGFCAGDDETEYPIFQDSNSKLLESSTNIVGVASDPDHCVLEPATLETGNVDLDHRKIYQEGELIDVNDNTKIGCFQGKWWDEWPIIFIDEETSVTWGGNERASFYLVNPTENPITYDLTLQGSSDLKDITSFRKTGENQASFTLEPSSIQTHQLAINAGTKDMQETATVKVTSSSIEGEDSADITVTDEVQTGSGEINEVSGITILQLSLLILLSSLLFFYFSRPEKGQ